MKLDRVLPFHVSEELEELPGSFQQRDAVRDDLQAGFDRLRSHLAGIIPQIRCPCSTGRRYLAIDSSRTAMSTSGDQSTEGPQDRASATHASRRIWLVTSRKLFRARWTSPRFVGKSKTLWGDFQYPLCMSHLLGE